MSSRISISPIDLIERNRKLQNPFLDLGNCGLTDNNIGEILDLLGKCTHITNLNLGSEYFSDPAVLWSTENNGQENRFSTIPLLPMPWLKQLQIRHAEIGVISNINQLGKLELLDLSLNSISKIENVSQLNNLTELALHGNFIAKIENLENLAKLEVLHLTRNRISKIEGLNRLSNLKQLILSNNDISKIENLEELQELETLDLNKNHIIEIRGLDQNSKLTALNLSDNLIKNLKNIINIKSLSSVFLNGNRIEDCPADIWQSNDIKQIRAHFESQKMAQVKAVIEKVAEDPNRTKDVKLILLGNSNTGKSNFVHYLQHGGFLETRNSTHGMEVVRWQPNAKRFPMLKDITVNIWDFGGQEYYHEAYRLFLSANAVYVVMWDNDSNKNFSKLTKIRNDEELELEFFEKRYWLDTVRFYNESNDSAPLILVQNKTDDQVKQKQRVSQDYFDKYKLTESHHISLLKGCNGTAEPHQHRVLINFEKELETVLFNAADKTEANPSWLLIRNEILACRQDSKNIPGNVFYPLLSDGKTSIELNKFNSACKALAKKHRFKLSDDDLYTLPRWLNKSGVVVYFENNELLNNKIFISPRKLSEKIYQLLSEDILIKKGEFALNNIQKSDSGFEAAFIEITKSLGLVYKHPDPEKKDYYIAPQYLPDKHPIEDLFSIASSVTWQDSFWVKVPLFYYKRLLNDLIVYYSSDQQNQAKYYWKHGIIFLKKGLRVLIKGLFLEDSKSEGVILVGVENGVNKKELQKEIFQRVFDFEKNNSNNVQFLVIPRGIWSDLNDLQQKPDDDISYLNNLELSYDGDNFVKLKRLQKLSAGTEQVFTHGKDNARLSLHRFSSILPFTLNTRRPKKIFISYSHQNTAWLNKLRVHMAGLRRSGDIDDWTDQEIIAGEKWDNKIKDNLEQADVFICLLSADFIWSEYIWNDELKLIFDKMRANSKDVIFVYVEPFDILSLKGTSGSDDLTNIKILEFEIIPKEKEKGQLKAASSWTNENEALAEIVQQIRRVVRK